MSMRREVCEAREKLKKTLPRVQGFLRRPSLQAHGGEIWRAAEYVKIGLEVPLRVLHYLPGQIQQYLNLESQLRDEDRHHPGPTEEERAQLVHFLEVAESVKAELEQILKDVSQIPSRLIALADKLLLASQPVAPPAGEEVKS